MSNANEKPASNVQAFLLVDLEILACDWTTKMKAQLSLDEGQIRKIQLTEGSPSTLRKLRKVLIWWMGSPERGARSAGMHSCTDIVPNP